MKKLIAITSLICLIAITTGLTTQTNTKQFNKNYPDDPQGRWCNPWLPMEQHNHIHQ